MILETDGKDIGIGISLPYQGGQSSLIYAENDNQNSNRMILGNKSIESREA